MIRSQRVVVSLVAAAATVVVPATARPADGDWILRVAPGYVAPTGEATYRGSSSTDFTDPRFPPLGRIDLDREDHVSAQGDLGIGLELEHLLTDTVGVTAGLTYTRLVGEAALSGEATFTPSLGEPPTPAPERAHTAPVTGGGAGWVRLTMLTAGVSLHVARGDKIDAYLGPLVGLAVPEFEFAGGSMDLAFGFSSKTPLAGESQSRPRLAVGGVFGVDVPLGGKGWRLSAAARYLWTDGLDPFMIQLGLGYRF
jgi:outer membrane protein W